MVFKRNNATGRPGGGRKYSTRPFGGKPGKSRGYGDSPQMHEAVCAACGKMAEVPFKPNGRKPVFCRDCFQKEDHAPRENSVRGAFGRSRFQEKRTFDAAPKVNDKIEKRLEEMDAKLARIIRELEAIKERNA